MIKVNTREEFLEAVDDYLPTRPTCVEIGVLAGEFSRMILDVLYPDTLVLIDPYVKNDVKYASGLTTAYSTEDDFQRLLMDFEKEIKSGEVILDRRFSYDAVGTYADGVFDFCYIDSDHTYEGVKRDLGDWLPKMKNNSIIGGHDFTDNPEFGVISAVNEFMEEHGFEMLIFNEAGGDWALKRKQ